MPDTVAAAKLTGLVFVANEVKLRPFSYLSRSRLLVAITMKGRASRDVRWLCCLWQSKGSGLMRLLFGQHLLLARCENHNGLLSIINFDWKDSP